jgi:NAD(P)-dependent dehydrogenase (short-subunit alcohol dehydrogenase family)
VKLIGGGQLAKYPSTKLYATVRSTKTATALQKLADDSKGRLVLLDADFTDSASVKALRSNVETFTSSLDQVIYNAGVLKGLAPITKAGLDPLRENLEVNLFGAYAAAIEFTPFVQRSNYPNKVFIIVGSNFGSLTTAKQNFDAHNAAFGTVGVNYTAAYDISKVSSPLKCVLWGLYEANSRYSRLRYPVWQWN